MQDCIIINISIVIIIVMLVTYSNQTPIVKYSNTIAGEHDAMRERDAAGERYRAGEPDRMGEEGAILCRSEAHLI